MSYTTYITDALVCGSTARNTSDKSFLLFTRDAGMLYASAKSVREERSKHRYALQDCSYCRVTLVRGKSGWRVTGAEPLRNLYSDATTREARALLRDVLRLMTRLVRGEEPHEELFTETLSCLTLTPGGKEEYSRVVHALRTLFLLGYIAQNSSLASVLGETVSYASLPEEKPGEREAWERVIEEALRESHL